MSDSQSNTAVFDSKVATATPKPKTNTRNKEETLPPYNVVLFNDNDHTFEYVIEMLGKICGHGQERGVIMAKAVHQQGKVIVYTAHKELAELKHNQITSYGTDWRIRECKGSMTASIEPAEGAD